MTRQSRQLIAGWTASLMLVLGLATAPGAVAAPTAGPGWTVYSVSAPTVFAPGSPANGQEDTYQVFFRNSGSLPTSGAVTFTDRLPAGLKFEKREGVGQAPFEYEEEFFQDPGKDENPTKVLRPTDEAGTPLRVDAYRAPEKAGQFISSALESEIWNMPCSVNTALTEVTCTWEHGPVNPGVTVVLTLGVEVPASDSDGEELVNTATVSGGDAPSASASEPNAIGVTPPEYGLETFNFTAAGINGLTDTQAGDHPYETTVSYFLNTAYRASEDGGNIDYYGPTENVHGVVEETKDFVVDLPPGLVGNPQVVPTCSSAHALTETCPRSSQIGVATIYFAVGGTFGKKRVFPEIDPIYNLEPEAGEPAAFQFDADGHPVKLQVHVSEETGYAARVVVAGVPRIGELVGVSTTFFGTPASDPDVFDTSVGASHNAFLQNPANCSGGPLTGSVSTDSWQNPGAWLPNGAPNLSSPGWKTKSETVYPSITGCSMLQFQPSIAVTPDTTQADEPTGLTVDLHVPQAPDEFPDVATPSLKDASVTLPAGMSLSPSAADGLQGCADGQFAIESTEAAACPEASVLGTVEISTPLLAKPLSGQVYLGTPRCNPCSSADAADGDMLRLFLQAQGSGVRIKREGKIYANPSTGQLTAKFEENPQLPFEDLQLHFKGGLRAGLATPQTCGTATTTADFSAWSAPITPDATPQSSFNVDWNGEGGACPASMPFNPSFSAGTSNPNAGQFSPLTLTFSREDREQDMSGIQVRTPPGLLGMLSSVSLCGEPQASLGTCSEASRIGSMTVAAGPGAHPFYEHGSLYLTGPYKGAPFGLSIVVPTVAGPFNLGNVVVRARIDVDPTTTALTVTSDPFPQIIDGIPLRLRAANITVDRPGFIFNPTNCNELAIDATITGAQGAQSQVSAPFAVAGCAGLPFGPKFTASVSAHSSRANGAALDVKLVYPQGAQSNVSKVKVELPKQLPSRLTTLQKACLASVFEANPAACPAASVVGVAKATTPVLPVALTGPAYFVSNGGAKFPNLVVILQGYGVRIDLIGDTFISNKGITSSTFENVPDVQVSSFELYLPEGPHSALAANGNLCKGKLTMPSSFTAQDGAQLTQSTKIQVTGCPKAKKAKAKASRRSRAAKAAARARGVRSGDTTREGSGR